MKVPTPHSIGTAVLTAQNLPKGQMLPVVSCDTPYKVLKTPLGVGDLEPLEQ